MASSRSGPSRPFAFGRTSSPSQGLDRDPPEAGRLSAADDVAGALSSAGVRCAFEALGGWPPSILVAVSGGLDSTVLLDVVSLAAPAGTRLVAAHLDHGWRGSEGARDAALLTRFCGARGVPLVKGVLGPGSARDSAPRPDPALGREAGRSRRVGIRPRGSAEAAARDARYAFLAGVARREGFACVVTGHTLDDQLETLLLRLERGGRAEGLAGILPDTPIRGVRVLRPLLAFSRGAVEEWAEARSLPFREDATNADPAFARNRLRRAALPRLCRDDAESLTRLAALRRRLVEAAAGRLEPAIVRQSPGTARLSAARLAALEPVLRREVLRRAFHRLVAPGTPLGERSLDQIERLLASPRGGRASLRGARLRVGGGAVVLEAGTAPAGSRA